MGQEINKSTIVTNALKAGTMVGWAACERLLERLASVQNVMEGF